MKEIKVVELFAGVGGFRIGLNKAKSKNTKYEVVWSNQWEPSTNRQHANEVYEKRWPKANHSGENIEKVLEDNFNSIPEHDLLVGGFPCQDYSVARTLNQAKGLIGKKGVLWWSIYTILKRQGDKAPKYIMLENVDRLLKSPSSQRGRDFAVMLAGLSDLGYAVEWRVINAAEYGFPQRRRRVFILGYKKGTKMYKLIEKTKNKKDIIFENGVIVSEFKVQNSNQNLAEVKIEGRPKDISENFSSDSPKLSPFENAGVMINRVAYTTKVTPSYKGKIAKLSDFLEQDETKIPEEFFVAKKDISKWKDLKNGGKKERTSKSGHKYFYSEGAMAFPDHLDKPARTIVTGEGGTTPSRFKHIVITKSGRYRRLMPEELEKLCMFPAGHTEGQSDTKRAFFMGNALVVGVITKLGKGLARNI